MPSLDDEWVAMCDAYQRKLNASMDCLRGLFRDGVIVSQQRLAECHRLRREAQQYRHQMDEWVRRNTKR